MKHPWEAFLGWKYNFWNHREWIRTKEYGYYYCNLWCFITDQRLCTGTRKETP